MSAKQPTMPVPPLQPLLFWETGVLLFVAGIVAARFPVPALTACALFAWADSRTRRPLCCLLAIACVFAGWWLGGESAPRIPENHPAWLEKSLSSRRAVSIRGTVVSSRGLPDRRLQILLDGVAPDGGEPLPGRLALTWQDIPDTPRPLPGQRVSAELKIRPVHGFRNQGTWNSEDYWHRQGVFFQAWTKQDDAAIRISGTPSWGAGLRERLRLRVAAALAPPEKHSDPPMDSLPPADKKPSPVELNGESSIIPALLFGDRYGLNTPDMERINAAGLTHSLALSGQHLAVVGLGALALAGIVGLLAPRLFLRFPAYSLIGLLSLPLAAGYLWLGDAPPSLVRAALMLAIVCLLRCVPDLLPERFRRNLRPSFTFADVLLLALFCMVLADPLCLYDLGVQLSFSAVAGIALCSPWFRNLWNDGPLSFSPLKALQGEVSPLRAAGSRFVRILWLTLGCSVAAQLATLPLVLDVGQGQSVLLEWPHGGRALVDGGGLFSDRFDVGRDLVSPVLTSNNLPRLDFIAVTHPDRDHLKGLLFIADNYTVGAAYTAQPEPIDTPQPESSRPLAEAFGAILASRGIPRHTLHAGNVLPLADGLTLEVLAPAPGVTPSGNDGLVFRLVLNGHGLALLPGDAEAPYLRALLRSGADLSADVLVLPHHGSSGSLVPALYDAVSPRLAIASAGAYNPYRLPSRKVRDALEQRAIPLRITGDEGEIAVHWDMRKRVGMNGATIQQREKEAFFPGSNQQAKDKQCD